MSNNGAAYGKLSGGISGTGNLTVYGNGYTNNSTNCAPSGMLACQPAA